MYVELSLILSDSYSLHTGPYEIPLKRDKILSLFCVTMLKCEVPAVGVPQIKSVSNKM